MDHSDILGLLELVSVQSQCPVDPESFDYFFLFQCTVIIVKLASFAEDWEKYYSINFLKGM